MEKVDLTKLDDELLNTNMSSETKIADKISFCVSRTSELMLQEREKDI